MDSIEILTRIDSLVKAYENDPDVTAGWTLSGIRAVLSEYRAVDDSIRRGLEQSAAGDVVDLGDFTQYADDTDDGVIQIGDTWDYVTTDGSSAPHTVVAVTDYLVSVAWREDETDAPTTMSRDYFLADRRLLSRKGE